MMSSSPRDRRVVVVDDHVLLAEALSTNLHHAGYDTVTLELPRTPSPDQDQDQDQLLTAITRARPGVVLLDLDLGPHGDTRRVIRPLARQGVAVVVLTGSVRRADWGECLALGARTVLEKTAPLGEVRSVVRRVTAGISVLAPEERDRLVAEWREHEQRGGAARRALTTLSPSERAVLAALRRGDTVTEIARRRVVTVGTVRSQVKSILRKLDVSSQVAAVGMANQVLGVRAG